MKMSDTIGVIVFIIVSLLLVLSIIGLLIEEENNDL